MAGVRIGDLFPPDDHIAQWVFALSLVAEDLMALQHPIRETRDADEIRFMLPLYRHLAIRLYEARRLVVATRELPEVAAFLGEDSRFVRGLQDVYLRGPEDRHSEIERLYRDLRHKSVHYPRVGGDEIREVLAQLQHTDARMTIKADGELVAEWTTLTAVLWSLGVKPGSLDWLETFAPRQTILMNTVANWLMLWGVTLPLYAAHRGIDLSAVIDLTGLPRDQQAGFAEASP